MDPAQAGHVCLHYFNAMKDKSKRPTLTAERKELKIKLIDLLTINNCEHIQIPHPEGR